jgi:hypothetical protein
MEGSRMTCRIGLMGTTLLALSLGGCGSEAGNEIETAFDDLGPDRPVAIVRTSTWQWEGEQTYIPLYADGTASGLVVVNFHGGLLYGTGTPDSWRWLDEDTVEHGELRGP